MARFAVIGLGRFGQRLAGLLAEAGAEVIGIDRRREIVESVRDRVTLAVCLDSVDEEALHAQGIDKVDVAVVGIGTSFEASVLTTAILKQLGVPRVISRATTNTRAQILARIGADEIVNPEKEAAERWCNRLLAPSIMERIELADGYSLVEVVAPASFHHKTIRQLEIAKKFRVSVVAIRRRLEEQQGRSAAAGRDYIISVPLADTEIVPDDVLILVGSDEAIADFPAD